MYSQTTPPSKTVKRPRYEQKFKLEYSSEFKFISKLRAGESFAFCTLCRSDICIAHGGQNDIKKHVGTKKHATAEVTASSQRSMLSFMQPDRSLDVTRAELLFMSFVVEYNIAFAAADHAGQLFWKMFPDSDIAKKYGSGCTKTGCMTGQLARSSQSKVAEVHSSGLTAFSIATDGSNDTESKLYPVVIRYHDPTTGRVDCTLLAVPNLTKDSTGQNILPPFRYWLILVVLEKRPLNACVVVALTNVQFLCFQEAILCLHVQPSSCSRQIRFPPTSTRVMSTK